MLLHGLCGTPLQVRYVARGLARAGYTVSCPQLAGHCGTFDDLRNSTWTDWYEGVRAALDALSEKCDSVIVAGLSGGSLLALILAADFPDKISGTMAIAPPLKLDGWAVPWYARFFNLVRHRFGADVLRFPERQPFGLKDPRVRDMVVQGLARGDSSRVGQAMIPGALMIELRWLSKALRAKLGSIEKPVLIIHPREDDRASLKNAAYLQQHLAGPVETLVLEDSYHIATMDRQRDKVVARMISFADELSVDVFDDSNVVEFKVQAAE